MKLTTKKLKQLIREELAHVNEMGYKQRAPFDTSGLENIPDRYNPEAVDALERFRLGLGKKLNKLNRQLGSGPMNDQRHDRNITNYEQLRKATAQLISKLKNNEIQMDAGDAMRELRMMGNFDAFFDD